MGSAARPRIIRLPAKLAQIRAKLGLTQEELAEKLSSPNQKLPKSAISKYESGTLDPPTLILLRYARLAKINLEKIVDDDLDLPR